MIVKLPNRSLVKTNLIMAGAIGTFLLMFLSLYGFNQPIYLQSTATFLEFLSVGFINIFLLNIVYRSGLDTGSAIKRVQWYLGGYFCACLFFLIPLTSVTHQGIGPRSHPVDEFGLWYFIQALARGSAVNTVILFVQTFILLQYEKSRAILENSSLKIANMEAANLLLKQQIQPHFLFNALSILKTLYRKDVSSGETYLVHLANFLRVSVSFSSKNVTRVGEEIAFCRSYLEMQYIRFGDSLQCDIQIPDVVMREGYVPSFSIQPLLENAIKHNEATDELPLLIRIYTKGHRIIVWNNMRRKENGDAPSGKGLTNLMERYKVLSEDDVSIRSDGESFSVGIKILKQ